MVAADDEEENKKILDSLDYLAMYINPAGLKKVREIRERGKVVSTNTSELGEVVDGTIISTANSDEEFAKFLAQNSEDGRAPVFNKRYVSG
jgi:hypothetical protein